MCTVRNAFDLINKSKQLSYYVYGQVSSSKKPHLWYLFMKNSMVFYEQVCVRSRTLKEIAANCDSCIKRMRLWQTQKHTTLVNGAYLQPLIFDFYPTVDLIKRFSFVYWHRLTMVVVIFHGTGLLFQFHKTGNQHNHGLTYESKFVF